MAPKSLIKGLLPIAIIAFSAFVIAGCTQSDDVDQMISRAKREAAKPVPTTSVEIPVEEPSPKEAMLETRLMEIQEVKTRLKKTPIPGEEAAGENKSTGESTKVVSSPKAELTGESSVLNGAGASSVSNISPLTPYIDNPTYDEPGSGTQVEQPKPKPKVSAFKTYRWGQSSRNNCFLINALTPDSGMWANVNLNMSGFFVKVSVKNIRLIPSKVQAASFKLITSDGRTYIATPSAVSDVLHSPIFRDKVLLPNEKYTAFLYFVFKRSTDIEAVWAPDITTVKYFRYLVGKPKIQYTY